MKSSTFFQIMWKVIEDKRYWYFLTVIWLSFLFGKPSTTLKVTASFLLISFAVLVVVATWVKIWG